jgi:hypothetical protein
VAIGRRELLLSGGAVGLAAAAAGYQRGYLRCVVDEQTCRADFRVLPYVTRPGAPVSTRTSYVAENGNPGLQLA